MMVTLFKKCSLLVITLLWMAVLVGCGQYSSQRTSNLLQYLYPGSEAPLAMETTDIPNVTLPLRVGLAFVPEGKTITTKGGAAVEPLTEKFKIEMMRELSAQLHEYATIAEVEDIPSTYLKVGGSFTNLNQMRTMTGLDVIALLSYDQVQFTDRGIPSLLYWTGIGWWFVPGEKNDTNTMLDVAVYHVPSHKPLLRATGDSRIYGYSTPKNQSQNLRENSEEGFMEAMKMLANDFKVKLDILKRRLDQNASSNPRP